MDFEKLKETALKNGFTTVGKLNMDALIFMPEVRDMCRADRCHHYGKSWRCPPAIGSIEDAFRKTESCTSGIIVQTTATLEDDFDYETMYDAMKMHSDSFVNMMREIKKETPDALGMGAGTCSKCVKCTYPDEPCRFPDDSYPSMEAYGLWVSDVCEKSGIPYNHGKGTITYISCVLFK